MAGAPRIAIVCDWLTNMGGAERTVLAMHKAFPDAPIFTSVFAPEVMPLFKGLDIRTTYLQKLPKKLRERHQFFPLQRTRAFRNLDLKEFDIIISSCSAEAKAVVKRPGAMHICYCHTPTRYYWSHYHQYITSPGFGPLNPLMRVALPSLVQFMRRQDLKAVAGVDHFLANSSTVATRIKQFYQREATVLHPPVSMERFRELPITGKRGGFVIVGRQVPYKRMDIAIAACNELGLPLTLLGTGPDHARLKKLAGPTITFAADVNDEQVALALTSAAGFINPQEEDFGITQVEALAAGCPVIAYAQGGALDVVKEGETGVFFNEQTVQSLATALKTFNSDLFHPKSLQTFAEQFSEERFIKALHEFVTTREKQKPRTEA